MALTSTERSRKWREANKERDRKQAREAMSRWRTTNPETNKDRIAKWRKENPARLAYQSAKRRTAQIERTPSWADMDEIALIYKQSASLGRLLGKKTHVDHIIPLQGKFVSGLHVPANLQIAFAEDNLRKGNNYVVN